MAVRRRPAETLEAHGFLRVAAASPPLRVGDVPRNVDQLAASARRAAQAGARLVVFPELSLTGYTAQDLFFQRLLLRDAREGVEALRAATADLDAVVVAGAPLAIDDRLFNVAVVLARGELLGVVPKTHLPTYREFYESRWFSPARDLRRGQVELAGRSVPAGTDLLFPLEGREGATLAVEICEDLWVPSPPSGFLAQAGATVIANPSASPETLDKAAYRRALVEMQSARALCGYVYAGSGVDESTTDLVYAGHCLVAENGRLLAESRRFARGGELVVADLDLEHLLHDRERQRTFGEPPAHAPSPPPLRRVPARVGTGARPPLLRPLEPHPFVPSDPRERDRRVEEIFAIQTAGLARRLEHTGVERLVLGLSGGLDSALALFVAVRTCALLGLKPSSVHAFTMPGFATSRRTRRNAHRLARALGATLAEIDIRPGARRQLQDLGHDRAAQDVTFENVQARYRTMLLLNQANRLGGIVVGTGDLSEIALGWNTYAGDHISHYNPNAGVPKTLVRHVVEWVAERGEMAHARDVIRDILDTPVSPELVRGRGRSIAQRTEELIGPYELHDFFLYHLVRWGSAPRKILLLAGHAFAGRYSGAALAGGLRVFLRRFFLSQWKRSVMPDGPKVGSVALSPRGDWRMPSDADGRRWLEELG